MEISPGLYCVLILDYILMPKPKPRSLPWSVCICEQFDAVCLGVWENCAEESAEGAMEDRDEQSWEDHHPSSGQWHLCKTFSHFFQTKLSKSIDLSKSIFFFFSLPKMLDGPLMLNFKSQWLYRNYFRLKPFKCFLLEMHHLKK